MELENYICSAEDVTTPSEKSGDQILKQCFRKGDVIYYAKPENIHMYQKHGSTQKTDGTGTRPSLESDGQTDTVNSGESLFKVFTFEQSSNDEDTEKCIAFWKSVMEKNLTPIKCTIIENTKKPIPSPQEKPKPLQEEEEGSHATDENIAEKIHEEYRDMWVSALKEIQRKKLHKIKLTNKARCSMCDSISSSIDQYVDKVDKREIKKGIKELNDWKSVSTKKQRKTPNKADANMKTSSTNSSLITTQKKGETPTQKSTCEKFNTENSSASLKEKIIRNLVPDTNTYIYKDVIGEKKKNGIYSKWRCNAVEQVCHCKKSKCDCNINPAIVAIEEGETSTTAGTENSVGECKKTELSIGTENSFVERKKTELSSNSNAEQREAQGVRSDCNEDASKQLRSQSDKSETFKDERFNDLKDLRSLFSDQNVDRFDETSTTFALTDRKSTIRKRTLSVFLQCTCSASSCDCRMQKEMLSRQQIEEPDWVIPTRTVVPVAARRSSLELYRKSMSKMKTLDRSKDSQSSIRRARRVPDNTAASTDADLLKEESSLRSWNVHEKPSILMQPHAAKLNKSISMMLNKSISMMLNDCHCSNEDCDCFHIEHVQKQPSLTGWDPCDLPARTEFKKMDSLDIAKLNKCKPSKGVERESYSSVQVLYPPSNFDDESSIFGK